MLTSCAFQATSLHSSNFHWRSILCLGSDVLYSASILPKRGRGQRSNTLTGLKSHHESPIHFWKDVNFLVWFCIWHRSSCRLHKCTCLCTFWQHHKVIERYINVVQMIVYFCFQIDPNDWSTLVALHKVWLAFALAFLSTFKTQLLF